MILLTGAAGFIGFHTTQALLDRGEHIVGIDDLNNYYDVSLKKARLEILKKHHAFTFYHGDIADQALLKKIFTKHHALNRIIHLAAQAGVRYSLKKPELYAHSNLTGHLAILEAARHCKNLEHLVYASSSSVYGGNTKQPFSVDDHAKNPLSLYAATKRAGELMSNSYAHLFHIPATGLRFFTVYGPWGRPDMAYYSFTKDILSGNPITVFNNGQMKRDFTWIGDCVDGIIRALDTPPSAGDDYCIGTTAHRVFNIGNNRAEKLMDFIRIIENAAGTEAEKIMAPMAPGDVEETWADIGPARAVFGYDPKTPLSEGIPRFVDWFCDYNDIKRAA